MKKQKYKEDKKIDNRATREKEESALKLIARGKLIFEEIAEDLELPVERVEELANFQLI